MILSSFEPPAVDLNCPDINVIQTETSFNVQRSTSTPDTIEAVFYRPKNHRGCLEYTLMHATALDAPTVWQESSLSSSNLSLQVSEHTPELDLITITLSGSLAQSMGNEGFLKFKAELIENPTSSQNDENIWQSEVFGWKKLEFALAAQSYSVPFLRPAIFKGTISSINVQQIEFAEAQFDDLLDPSVSYFVEVTEGDYEGHRFDVVSASANSIELALDSNLFSALPPFNTITGAPPIDLTGDTIVLRKHWTIADLFDPNELHSTGADYTADQVQVFSGNSWQIYWLYDNQGNTPRWVDVGDSNNNIKNGVVIPPGQGLFFNNRGQVRALLSYGEVRSNDFAHPLFNGFNLVGGGYPMDQLPSDRNYSFSGGLRAAATSTASDNIFLWDGDETPGASTYTSFYLYDSPGGDKFWVQIGDTNFTPAENNIELLNSRAIQIRNRIVLPNHIQPLPWN